MKGKFLTIEGGEGVGKSTLQRRLVEALEDRGIEAIATREPGGIALSERIRALLLDPELEMGSEAETLLFLAARAEHLEKIVRPALKGGCWVICDRFSDSTIAYQGYGRERDVARVTDLCRLVERGTEPELTLWIDLDPLKGLERAQRVTQGRDRMEEAERAFHKRVYRGFSILAKGAPERIARLDGELDQEGLFASAWSVVEGSLL